MRKKAWAILLLVIAMLLSACQPTPEKEIIVNKNNGQLEKEILTTPSATRGPYKVPTHWTDTSETNKLKIKIDTDVVLPDTDTYPVVKLERESYTRQQIDEMVDYFAKGKKLYAWPSLFTKKDYEAQIVDAERGSEVDGKYVVTDDSKQAVADLKKKYEAAPDDSPRKYVDTSLTYSVDPDGTVRNDAGQNFLSVGVENGNGKDTLISIVNYAKGQTSNSCISYSRYNGHVTEAWYNEEPDESETGWKGYGKILKNITLDKNFAQAQAEKVINDLGIKDIALVDAEKAVLDPYENLWGLSNNMPRKGGYVFVYMRKSGGIVGYDSDRLSNKSSDKEDPPAYSPPFRQEKVEIAVSDEGIEEFTWYGYSKVVDTENENVELLPFDQIQKHLIDQIRYKKSFENLDKMYRMSDFTVTVKSAQLRLGYIGVKDNVEEALLVPVWVFETEFSQNNSVLKKIQSYEDDTYMLNAIDGGLIEDS